MVLRSALAATLLVAAVLAVPASVHAAPAGELQFTTVVTDDVDDAGFYDILKVEVGEPGDNTLVFRVTLGGTQAAPLSSVYWDFDGPMGKHGLGFDETGAPGFYQSATGDYQEIAPESCSAAGAVFTCIIQYTSIGVGPGTTLTSNRAVSYSPTVAMDYAPGTGPYIPAAFLAGLGPDYTLTGCTLSAGCPSNEPVVVPGAKTVYGNLTGSAIAISGTFTSPTDDTYVYNWTTTATTVDVAYNATVLAGKATYTVKDGAGKTVATGTMDKNATKTQPFDKLTAGKWQVTLAYSGFKGVAKLNVSPKGTTGTNGGSGSTGGSGTGNGSGSGVTDKSDGSGDTATAAVVDGQADTQSEASPGIDAVMLAIVGLASVMIARRRLE